VDAACPEEFEGTYPFHRVFHALEWAGAATFCAGDRSAAAALLWTLKEAAVKGLGVGFNGMDPLEVKARVLGADGSGIHSLVEAGSARLYARSRRHRGRWLSLALEEAGP
jgi:phosphopantetheinyl transferase